MGRSISFSIRLFPSFRTRFCNVFPKHCVCVIFVQLRLPPETTRRSLAVDSFRSDVKIRRIKMSTIRWMLWALVVLVGTVSSQELELGSVRVVFQTNFGDIEFGFYPNVAPQTVEHIFKLVRLGCYNTNHFFRVDKGFVAQVADVVGGRSAPMNEEQRNEAEKNVVGEFSDFKHVRGVLSMGRYADPNSATSSFSILLGDAPHLDGQYTIFGKVTKGDETLKKLEEVPTRREDIFVMGGKIVMSYHHMSVREDTKKLSKPTERITIHSSYYYDMVTESCEKEKSALKRRLTASAIEVERQRMKCFP